MAIASFADKVAFVTGGGSGIGLGIARALAARGAFVVLADLRADHLERALASFAAEGTQDRVSASRST